MRGSAKLTKKQSKAAKLAKLAKLAKEKDITIITPEQFAHFTKAAEDMIPAIIDGDAEENRVVKPSEAKGILFPTIFTTKTDNIIRCGRCGGVDVVVLIVISLETFKPRVYRSCGVCCGSPNHRIFMKPDHFIDKLTTILSVLELNQTPEFIADQFIAIFDILCDRMKKFTCKQHFNFCFHCKNPEPASYCRGCLMVRFCSEECNKAAWKEHKKMCETHRKNVGKHQFVNFD